VGAILTQGWLSQPNVHGAASPDFVEAYNFGLRDPRWSVGTLLSEVGKAGQLVKVTARNQLVRGINIPRITTAITLVMIAEKYGQISGISDFLYGECGGGAIGGDPYNYGFYESSSTGNLSVFVHNGTTGVNVGGGTAWTANAGPQVWVFTYDGANIRLYLNGAQVNSGAQTGSVRRNTTATLRCNGWNASTPNFGIYAGAVSARAFSASEIAAHFSTPALAWGALFDSSALDLIIPDAAGGATYNDSITEALTLADAATVAAILAESRTEAASLADSPSSAAILTAAGSEAITAADVITAALVGAAAASEAASLTDAPSAAAIYAAAAAESVTLTDAPTSAAIYASSSTDALTLSDIGSLGLIDSITEALALSDSATATLIAASAISEAMTLADAGSSAAIRVATALESLSLTDSIAAAGIFASSVVDAMALADLVAESGSGGPVIATDLNYLLKYPSGGFYILRPRNNWTIQ